MTRRTASIVLAFALAGAGTSIAVAATPLARHGASIRHAAVQGPRTHAINARPKFRPSRMAAAQEAARLGATVGQGCHGKADIALNEHRWVVLCSNGKSYLLNAPAGPQAGPAVECSLAGTGPQPACFAE